MYSKTGPGVWSLRFEIFRAVRVHFDAATVFEGSRNTLKAARSRQFEHRGPPHPGPLPKERESFSTVSRRHWTVAEYLVAKWFSLSLGERAGVRGKVGPNWILRALG